jgi:flagellar hook-associated protein FlgK
MASSLESLQRELNEDVYTYVAEVNGIIEEIGELNGRIYETEISGRDASYLRDTLHNKINELSQYGNVTVEEIDKLTIEEYKSFLFSL